MSPVIELKDIIKSYIIGTNTLEVLKGINLQINQGEMVAIMGPSGSGKSSIMNIIGLLDRPTSGIYKLNGFEVKQKTDDELAEIRNKTIGFVFQSFYLLPKLTALQNVALPLRYRQSSNSFIHERTNLLLEKVGMGKHKNRKPKELSGGQQQRVAIARALAGNPSVLLADEPTGALDSKTSEEIMELFLTLNQEEKATVVMITHSPTVGEQCQRIINVYDGNIIEDN